MSIKNRLKELNITLPDAPAPVGAYSAFKRVGNLLFISGQIPLCPKKMELVEGIDNQIRQVFKNIKNILEASEMNYRNIVKLTVLLDDLDNFENVNLVMSEIFEEPYPARAAYQVVKLPKGSFVEIETIAFKE